MKDTSSSWDLFVIRFLDRLWRLRHSLARARVFRCLYAMLHGEKRSLFTDRWGLCVTIARAGARKPCRNVKESIEKGHAGKLGHKFRQLARLELLQQPRPVSLDRAVAQPQFQADLLRGQAAAGQDR